MNKSNIKLRLATNNEIDVLKLKTERNSLGILKTLIVLLLIFLQIALFIVSYIYFFYYFQWFWAISFGVTIVACIYVISSNKNSQSKPIWVLFLLLCFSFGYIIYFISNERVFWHKYKKRYNKILTNTNMLQKQQVNIGVYDKVNNDCNYLYSAGKFVTYTNTDTRYFASGASMFDNILEDIEKAEKFIFIEYFIISDGILMKRLFPILEQKAKQGVDIRIIYDDFGSHGTFKRKTKRKIKSIGIKLNAFNRLLPKFNVLLNYRDHRKIVVIDGQVAYTGGANFADEYINEKRSHGYWKDSGIRLQGPAVDGFTLMFLRQYQFATKTNDDYSKYINLAKPSRNKSYVVPYADGLEYSENIGKNAYINMISNANKKIYIMSPYFVIDDAIRILLINKARAGVDVRIILPDVADKKMVYIISRNNAEKLIDHGIKLYVMKNSFVHSKVMLTENSAIVGSINMDLRSFYQQFESSVYLNDDKTLEQIDNDFLNTFNKCIFVNKSNLRRNRFGFRIKAGILI